MSATERARELVEGILTQGDRMEPVITKHLAELHMDTPADELLLDRIRMIVETWAVQVRELRKLSRP